MEHTKELLSVPLSSLVASPFNVRRYSFGQVEELAALIDSQGLLLNRRSRELEKQGTKLEGHQDGWADEAEVINLEEQDIAARQRAVQQGLRVWAPEVKAVAGVVFTLSREGEVEVIRGLVRQADRRAVDAAHRAAAKGEPGGAVHGAGGDSDRSDPTATASSHATDSGPLGGATAKRADFSDSLLRRLSAHRTLALQVALSRNVPVALAALAHVLAKRVLSDDYRRAGPALQIVAQPAAHALTSAADDLKAAPAWLALQTAGDGWTERLPQDRSTWFEWLLSAAQADLLDLMALCTALTVNALPSSEAAVEANVLATTLGLDMSDWWQPTAEGFLNHVSKAQIVQALREATPSAATDGVESMKKDELVATALNRLKGKRWLPTPLGTPSA